MFPDYEKIEQKTDEIIHKFNHGLEDREDFRELYTLLGVVKVTFEMQFETDPNSRVMSPEFIMASERSEDGSITLFESSTEFGDIIDFSYPRFDGREIRCRWFLSKKVDKSQIDEERYLNTADKMYMLQGVTNLRRMLDFAINHDPQTGIPNGVGFRRMYREAKADNPDVKYALVYINLQNFRYFNERLGSRGGDEVIVQYSRRLTLCVEPDEGVCRLGGDNFLLFVKPENLDSLIQKLSDFNVDNISASPRKSFSVSAWIGIDAYDDGEEMGTRIGRASVANMFAKQHIKQPVVYYSDKFHEMLSHNKHIASIFSPAIENHEFSAFFQAKVSMATGELKGFEALCRWKHEDDYIFPDQFIPVIDRLGLTYELDMEILRYSCSCIRKWLEMELTPPVISVNFSRKDIFIPDIEQEIKKTVDSYDIMPAYVEIEITETATEAEYARIIEFTKNLKAMGFRIAIDDFGTGYSSLSLIHNINADVLKIDKTFVTAIHKDKRTEVLVESIINIAKHLDMDLVAEGVETAEEGEMLMRLGCDIAQGYFYSRPADYEATTAIIRNMPFKPIGVS